MKKIFLASFFALVSAQAESQTQAGKTMIAKGKVAAELEQNSRKLKRRSPIYDNERVVTGNKSKAQLRMTDGGMIALKENSELVIANYQYSGETGEGSVAMELLKGGLRSVTGAIKTETGDYNLKTPVGSIGIRGTHFEVELVDGDMFLAVWDGAVDLTVDTGTGQDVVSFGEGEDFSFGIVTQEGEVTQLLEAPANFNQGHSEDGTEEESSDEEGSESDESEASEDGQSEDENSNSNDSEDSDSEEGDSEEESSSTNSEDGDSETSSQSNDDSDTEQGTSSNGEQGSTGSQDTTGDQSSTGNSGGNDTGAASSVDQGITGTTGGTETAGGAAGADQDLSGSDNSFIADDEINESINNNSLEDIVAARTGIFTYGTVSDSTLTSSAGGASGLQMNMTIDFDSGAVPTGSLSFNDNGGEWFAAFSGFLIGADIDLDVTFASHGDNLADGDINAFFINEANSVSGDFSLFELNNPSVTASGVYRIE